MRRSTGAFGALLLSTGILLAGCGSEGDPPCEALNITDPPTAEMRASTLQGAEVEIELEVEGWAGEQKAECVVVIRGESAEWEDQTDDDAA